MTCRPRQRTSTAEGPCTSQTRPSSSGIRGSTSTAMNGMPSGSCRSITMLTAQPAVSTRSSLCGPPESCSTMRTGLLLRHEIGQFRTPLRHARQVRGLPADLAVAEELGEHAVEDLGLVGLPLVTAVVDVEELHLRQQVLLLVPDRVVRQDDVVQAVHVDAGD